MGNCFTLLCVAFCVAFGSYVMSNKPLPKSGVWRLWCPSIVSVTGTAMCVLTYFVGWVWLGNFELTMVFYTCWAFFDAMDGKIGRNNDLLFGEREPGENFSDWFYHPGTCEQGALLDSTCDKLKIIVIYSHAMWSVGWVGLLSAAVVATEIWAGRQRLLAYEEERKNKNVKTRKSGNHSELVGKVKTWVQQFCLIPLLQREFFGGWILGGCLLIALSFTIWSVAQRKAREHKRKKETLNSTKALQTTM